jgi:hypothetical protein
MEPRPEDSSMEALPVNPLKSVRVKLIQLSKE